jgi:hypothetical protein
MRRGYIHGFREDAKNVLVGYINQTADHDELFLIVSGSLAGSRTGG